jgi:hypothetical protein
MTEKYLKSLIDKLNKNKRGRLIQIRPLSATVDFAKVWTEKPKSTDNISADRPYNFYFIKNLDGLYVATVLDMWSDLHWFVDKKQRHQGHLTKAMKETILFHLFKDKEQQRITIDKNQIGEINFQSSQNVALNLGFIKTENDDYILNRESYPTEKYIYAQNTQITEERLNELKKEINFLGRSLWLIQSEIEMKLGDLDYAEELKELVDEIRKHTWRLEDVWCENKNVTI